MIKERRGGKREGEEVRGVAEAEYSEESKRWSLRR